MTELAEDVFLEAGAHRLAELHRARCPMSYATGFATAMGLLVEAHSQRLRGRKLAQQTGRSGKR